MDFNLIEAWLDLKRQLPELPIEGVGAKYIYPLFILLMIGEYVQARHLFDLKESWAGVVMGLVATLIKVIANVFEISIMLFLFYWAEPFREQYLGYGTLGTAWYVWIICLLFDDHNFYWHHRIAHNVRFLWAAHLPHHSGKMFNLTVSIRNGWFIEFFKPIYWMWMPLVGFEPIMIATCLIINSFYQFFLHTQLVPSLGWYEKIFNTPWIHVVHHSSNTEYLDRNHGGILVNLGQALWNLAGAHQRSGPQVRHQPQPGLLQPDHPQPVRVPGDLEGRETGADAEGQAHVHLRSAGMEPRWQQQDQPPIAG